MNERERLSSRLGFIMLSAGCAIGCGNVWKFPWMCGQNGGGSFMLLYILCLLVLGLPVMVMELAVGRGSQRSIARSFDVLEPKGSKWHCYRWVGFAGNYLLMMFYTTISGWMVEIVQESAGLVPQDALQKQQQQKLASDLKIKYGDYLLGETDGYCPFPGCGKQLTITNKGKAIHTYEVSLIDKSKPATPDNLIAMCPQCYATYLLDDSKKLSKELKEIKNILSTHKQSVHLLDDLPLEKGIVGVIRKVKKIGEKELVGASLDPKEIKQKLSPSQDMALYIAVNGYVTTYYTRIKEIMMNLDKRGEIDYDEIQDQIHAFYKRLKKANKSRLETFNEIVGKIHRVTLQDDLYC